MVACTKKGTVEADRSRVPLAELSWYCFTVLVARTKVTVEADTSAISAHNAILAGGQNDERRAPLYSFQLILLFRTMDELIQARTGWETYEEGVLVCDKGRST